MKHLYSHIQHHLDQAHDPDSLHNLFCHILNWEVSTGERQHIASGGTNGEDVIALPIAQLGGIPVFQINWQSHILPTVTQRRRVQSALSNVASEHLICYVVQDGSKLAFVWARHRGEKQVELRTLSYTVGSPARTTIERLALLHVSERDSKEGILFTGMQALFNDAFDVEDVTRQFLSQYRKHVAYAEEQIDGIYDRERRIFMQKLFTQLLVVVFLQHKEWLIFHHRSDYLQALWDDHQQEQQNNPTANFYRDRLKPLFLAWVRGDEACTISPERIGYIPFLNGGLFDETDVDHHDAITVPDKALEPLITDLFSTFNFTASERTPFAIEVAVDPEMLGKMFEELIAGRHERGSYYTPRAMVAFMCREGLKGYLGAKLPNESPEALTHFVDERRVEQLSDPIAVGDALRSVRVCDPACGSGAYVLGMLQELVSLREALHTGYGVDALSTYQRKREIIQHNLYGIDRDSFAVRIARLRLWISLAVEYEHDKPLPLIDLGNSLAVGDSLADPSNTTPFVDGGFDIVVANPPYVRMELLKAVKPVLRHNFPEVHSERADLYVYFYALAVQILKHNGMLVFISPNKWLRARYGKHLRHHLAKTTNILSITDFGGMPVFADAKVDTVVFVAQKSQQCRPTRFTQVDSLDAPDPDTLAVIARQGSILPPYAINGETWTLTDESSAQLLATMEQNGIPLEAYVQGQLYYGIKTGLNAAFIIDEAIRTQLLRDEHSAVRTIIKPFVTGKHIQKWRIDGDLRYLLFMDHGIDTTELAPILDYLHQFRSRLEQRATQQQWYELQQPQSRYAKAFKKPKIIFPDIANRSRFTLDMTGAFIGDTAFAIGVEDLYLLGILNSAVVWNYVGLRAATLGNSKCGSIRLKRQYMANLPIPPASPADDRKAIEGLVQQCLDAQGSGATIDEWEAEIDARVAWLYGVRCGG